MNAENRLEIARRRVADAEAAVERQARIVEDLQKAGQPAQGAITLLALLHGNLNGFREALAVIEAKEP